MHDLDTPRRYEALILTEPKAQRWRAIMVMRDGKEALLFVGSNQPQVKQHYQEPFFELYDDDERRNLHEIRLQQWIGDPDRGHWLSKSDLPIPTSGSKA